MRMLEDWPVSFMWYIVRYQTYFGADWRGLCVAVRHVIVTLAEFVAPLFGRNP